MLLVVEKAEMNQRNLTGQKKHSCKQLEHSVDTETFIAKSKTLQQERKGQSTLDFVGMSGRAGSKEERGKGGEPRYVRTHAHTHTHTHPPEPLPGEPQGGRGRSGGQELTTEMGLLPFPIALSRCPGYIHLNCLPHPPA
jgi:hypothetical protein